MHAVRPARSLAGALTALALAVALTACGSDGSASTADEEPGAASTSPSTRPSATESPSTASDEPSATDDAAQVDVDQFLDRLQTGIDKTKQAHIEFTMSGAGGDMKGTGDVDYTVKPPEMQMSMDIGEQSLGMLLVEGAMYVQFSQAGDKYLKYDLSDPTNPLGSGLADQLDPASSMESFTKAVTAVTSSGKDDVHGQSLDRFVMTVDTTKLADQTSAAQLPPEMEVTVWLDDEDRMVKTSMAMGAVQYDATLSDFDKPVELQAPPADQVQQPPTS